jgi:predicted nucleic acid-binding protein
LEGLVQIVTSPAVVAEYREVVRRPKFARYGFPPLWLEFLIDESLRLDDDTDTEVTCPDPKDLPFLALAHGSGAWLVTGNLKNFPKSDRSGVRVLSPGDYLAYLLDGFRR